MKRIFKWILAIVLYYSSLLWLFERFSRYSREGLWILLYHRIADTEGDILKQNVSPKHFERQMLYLKKRYHLISLSEALRMIEKGMSLPACSLAITFDDGYRDNYLNAYPILKKFGIPATIFLVTDFIGKDNLLWFDELLELIEIAAAKKISLGFSTANKTYHPSDAHSKNRLISYLFNLFIEANPSKLQAFLEELRVSLKVDRIYNPAKVLLNWQEIKQMSENGIEFGSHGRSHIRLTNLNYQELEEEIVYSKKTIEKNIGRPVSIFSIPFGTKKTYNEMIVTQLQKAGYKAACLNISGKNKDNKDLFKLKRRAIAMDTSSGPFGIFSKELFACEISGIFDILFRRL